MLAASVLVVLKFLLFSCKSAYFLPLDLSMCIFQQAAFWTLILMLLKPVS